MQSALLPICRTNLSGASSSIFKAPATGLVFALEVPYRDDFARRMLVPAGVAAAAGYLVFAAFTGTAPLFAVAGSPPFDLRSFDVHLPREPRSRISESHFSRLEPLPSIT